MLTLSKFFTCCAGQVARHREIQGSLNVQVSVIGIVLNGSPRIGECLQGTRVETGVGQCMTLVEHHKSYQRIVR